MGYKVRVTTASGVRWLRGGILLTKERLADYHVHPSGARCAATRYMNEHVSEHVFELVHAPGGSVAEVIRPQLKLTLHLEVLANGAYRVWSTEASVDIVTADFVATFAKVAKDWAEQVEQDLPIVRPPVDIYKLDMGH